MNISVKGVRKKSRILWEVKPINGKWPKLHFWRTDSYTITRDIIKEAGLDVDNYGAKISQLTFRIRKKT